MSHLIDFKYPCPACKHVSGQCAKKPTLITPTVGWVKCPECECELQINLTFDTKHRMANGRPQLRIVTMKVKQSKKHHEKIMAQRERDKKRAAEIKQEVDDVGFKVLPPEPPAAASTDATKPVPVPTGPTDQTGLP